MDLPDFQEFDKISNDSDSDYKSREKEKFLDLTITTEDGTEAYIFSHRIIDDEERFSCHLCDVVIIGQEHVQPHIDSSKHQLKLEIPNHPRSLFKRFVSNEKTKLHIQNTIDLCKQPLLGLEYLIEIFSSYNKEPFYTCMLCGKKGDPRVAMAHMQSFNHRSKYLAIHFPTAYRKLTEGYPRNKDTRKFTLETVHLLCQKIENHYGRLTPMLLDQEEYDFKKEEYAKQIINDKHIRETINLTFEEYVDMDELIKYACVPTHPEDQESKHQNNRADSKANNIKSNNQPRTMTNNKEPADFYDINIRTSPISSLSSISSNESEIKRYRSKSRSRSPSRSPQRYKRNYSRERERHDKYLPPRSWNRDPKYRNNYSRSPIAKKYKRSSPPPFRKSPSPKYTPKRITVSSSTIDEKQRWVKYRSEMDIIEKDMTTMLKYYEKNPEKHPTYSVEWKKFWNRRYKELQASGKDPSKHDFKTEWIHFWNKRMQQMHDLELKAKKEDLKKKLELFFEEKTMTKIKFQPIYDDEEDDDVIVLSPPMNRKLSGSKKPDNNKRALSPWEENDKIMKKYRSEASPRLRNQKRDRERERERDRGNPKAQRRPLKEYTTNKNEINVVISLRHITAIEDQLGSLGPKINNLLSTALSLEKACHKSSDKLLADPNNIVFFETIKEKLIGQLMAGIIERHLISATKAAIHSIEEILSKAEKLKLEAPKDPPPSENSNSQPPNEPEPEKDDFSFIHSSLSVIEEAIVVEGVGPIEKEVLAQHIASALVATGQADISQEALEKLVEEIIGPKEVPKINSLSKVLLLNKDQDYIQALEKMNSTIDKENLSEGDIIILLNKFKDMNQEDQNTLKLALKTIETKDTNKINNLRTIIEDTPINYKFEESPSTENTDHQGCGRLSPFSSRCGNANPSPSKREYKHSEKLSFDDSDDEYTFEDIYTAASKNVDGLPKEEKIKEKDLIANTTFDKKKEENIQKEKAKDSLTKKLNDDPTAVLKETKEMIANIMGQLPVKYSQNKNIASPIKETILSKETPPPKEAVIPTITAQTRIPPTTNQNTYGNNHQDYNTQNNQQYPMYSNSNYQYPTYDQGQTYQQNNYDNYNNYYTMPTNNAQPQNQSSQSQYQDPSYNFNYSYQQVDPNYQYQHQHQQQFQQNPGFY